MDTHTIVVLFMPKPDGALYVLTCAKRTLATIRMSIVSPEVHVTAVLLMIHRHAAPLSLLAALPETPVLFHSEHAGRDPYLSADIWPDGTGTALQDRQERIHELFPWHASGIGADIDCRNDFTCRITYRHGQ